MSLPIIVNGRFLTRAATGVDRFAAELLKAWWPKFGLGRAALAVPSPELGAATRQAVELGIDAPMESNGTLAGHAWEQLQLPSLSRGRVLLNLCNSGPIAYRRQIAVIHDAGAVATPGSYSFAYRSWHRCLMYQLIRRARVVATVSKFSASELMRFYRHRKARFEIVSEGGEHILRHPADRRILGRHGLLDRPYVLAVGSRSPNKNLIALIRAAELLPDIDFAVVTAGGSNRAVFAGTPSQGDKVINTGYVTNAELRALYEGAQCFIFPSFYEGFGLPPLEAMNCGCPVAVSRRASMPEICADAALYFDPDDHRELAEILKRILASAQLRTELREMGLARARTFSWDLAALQFEHILTSNFHER